MIAHRLITALEVWRPAGETDAGGGESITYSHVGDIRCQVSQPSREERRTAQREGADLSHVLHMSATADVARGDQLRGSVPSALDGRCLRVTATVSNSRATYLRVECEATQPEGAVRG